MQGWHGGHSLCPQARPGGVWATHRYCCRVCRTIRLLDIKMAREVLGWQVGRQRTILPSLVGVLPMALQHRQNQPSGALRCLFCRNLLCDQGLEQHEDCDVDCTCPVEHLATPAETVDRPVLKQAGLG